MSDHIPFEIHSEIMKTLPVKSLIRFRSVCKAWKSLIESSAFIARYSGQHEHLLVRYTDELNDRNNYVLIVDDDTFPKQKVSVTIPQSVVNIFSHYKAIVCSYGLLCLYNEDKAVIWNPSIRKAVAVTVPNMVDNEIYSGVLGFGVCSETNDVKIVKINYISWWSDIESVACIPFQVEVFTLSTGVWRRPYSSILPRKSTRVSQSQVVRDGVIYWLAIDGSYDLIVSFDLTSEEYREVNLPDSIAHDRSLSIYKLRESLVVVGEGYVDYKLGFDVWMMEDGVPKSFKKLFTVSSHSPDVSVVRVLGFRKTGEPLIEASVRAYTGSCSILAAYDPYSKAISDVMLEFMEDNQDYFSCSVYPYMETLFLL